MFKFIKSSLGCLFGLLSAIMLLIVFSACAVVFLLPVFIARNVEKTTGYPTSVKRLYINPFMETATVEGVLVDMPDSETEINLLDMAECRLDMDLLQYFRSDTVVVRDLFLHVNSITYLVDDENRHRSFDFLEKLRASGEVRNREDQPEGEYGSAPAGPLKIDHCLIELDAIYVLDLSRSTEPELISNGIIRVELDNLQGVEDLVYTLVMELLKSTDSGAFKDLLKDFQKNTDSADNRLQNLEKLRQLMKAHVEELPDIIKNFIEKFRK